MEMKPSNRIKILVPAAVAILVLAVAGAFWLNRAPRTHDGPSPAAVRKNSEPNISLVGAEELRQRIASAAVQDYPGLMRLVMNLGDVRERKTVMSELLKLWLKADLESFIVFLDEMEIEGGPLWRNLTPAIMAALPGLDEKATDYFQLRGIIERVIVSAAASDPKNALGWAREWLVGNTLDSALASIATELAEVDPQAAMGVVSDIKALSNRSEAAAAVGRVLGATDPDLGLKWAANFSRETDKAFVMSGVLTGLAETDGSRAALEFSTLVDAMRENYRRQVLADRAASGKDVGEEYEGLSPEEILKAELARPNPNLIYLEDAAFSIATAMARGNPQRALDWAKSLDLYQGGAVATGAVYEEWISSAPRQAYQSYLMETSRRPEISERVFGAWATADSQAAATAALALTAGAERDHAVEGVARGWIEAGGSPQEIARWAENLTTESEKDRVRSLAASEAAFDNPVFAWRQAEQIRNQTKRSEAFQEVFPSLVKNDPQLARQALSGARLSTVEIEYFESMLPK